ncbi:MAG: DUF1616 domain-containing protein [Dehalococcoidia bacterium]|nr:MAG: DUF1616 domain-containing protein [Dehalococcoidia bacterium]
MRFNIGSGIVLQGILVIILVVIIAFIPLLVLRIILGLPFLLFSPGYSLILALFPKKDQITGVERVALSFGLSIAIVPLIGLVLNYTPMGITLESTLYSITGFIFIVSIIAVLRLRKLDESDRFVIGVQSVKLGWSGTRLDRALSAILIISLLASISVLGYTLAVPKVGEKFTEFYVLGPQGEASDYPLEITVGEETPVILGVVNHEQGKSTYLIEIVIDGVSQSKEGSFTLENEEKWEKQTFFQINQLGNDQKVEFRLFKNGQVNAYRSLHLWVDVK